MSPRIPVGPLPFLPRPRALSYAWLVCELYFAAGSSAVMLWTVSDARVHV